MDEQNPAFPVMAQSVTDVHLDILKGKDETLDVSDVLLSGQEERLGRLQMTGDLHAGMERRLNL